MTDILSEAIYRTDLANLRGPSTCAMPGSRSSSFQQRSPRYLANRGYLSTQPLYTTGDHVALGSHLRAAPRAENPPDKSSSCRRAPFGGRVFRASARWTECAEPFWL